MPARHGAVMHLMRRRVEQRHQLLIHPVDQRLVHARFQKDFQRRALSDALFYLTQKPARRLARLTPLRPPE